MSAASSEPLVALADDMMRSTSTGGVVVRDATADWGTGTGGERVVRLALVLDDPPDGVTWDPDVLLDLQSRALGFARDHGLDDFVFLDLQSRSEAAEDALPESDLGDLSTHLDKKLPQDDERPSHPQQ